MEAKPVLGVIGGSGLYAMQGLASVERREIETPFGQPSSPVVLGKLGGKRIAFIARHGVGHVLSPSEVNYRANIYALKLLGVERVLAISACGSLREDYAPGEIVVPDQLFDHTKNRIRTFFEDGLVVHVSVAEPFCADLSRRVTESVEQAGGTVHHGGTFITIEGPRFSTRAESNTFRAWNMSIIGMTTSPEAFLAREAELCYGVMAHVTDYDVWHVSEEPVTVEMVIRTLQANTELAQRAIMHLLETLPEERDCDCKSALEFALITQPDRVSKETRERLALLVGRYLP
ncbi:MAG: S-methyl-5'-thioadenosine phosphorylase [Anaerolineales bacterium]|jgi:5'-methylthioadenosine phosphorylase